MAGLGGGGGAHASRSVGTVPAADKLITSTSGNIQGIQGSVWQQNLNSTEADIGINLDFGNGDNEIFLYVRTDSVRGIGYKIGFRPGLVTYYDVPTGDRLFPSIPVQSPPWSV